MCNAIVNDVCGMSGIVMQHVCWAQLYEMKVRVWLACKYGKGDNCYIGIIRIACGIDNGFAW